MVYCASSSSSSSSSYREGGTALRFQILYIGLFVIIWVGCRLIHQIRSVSTIHGFGFELATSISSIATIPADTSRSRAPKNSVDIIMAHYNHDLEWINMITSDDDDNYRVVVYTKNATPPVGPFGPVTVLPNVGREGHTYLYHIVSHYDQLAPWNIFSQDDEGHFRLGFSWQDVFQATVSDPSSSSSSNGWYMAYSTQTIIPHLVHSNSFDSPDAGALQVWDTLHESCPSVNRWTQWWYHSRHPAVIFQKNESSPAYMMNKDMDPVMDFYQAFVADINTTTTSTGETIPSSFTLTYSNGARFAVSRDRIRMRPKQYYQRLLESLSYTSNPWESYLLEIMWYDAFHPDRLQAVHGTVCNNTTPFQPLDTNKNYKQDLTYKAMKKNLRLRTKRLRKMYRKTNRTLI